MDIQRVNLLLIAAIAACVMIMTPVSVITQQNDDPGTIGTAPSSLRIVTDCGERIYDSAKSNNWDQASDLHTKLKSALQQLGSESMLQDAAIQKLSLASGMLGYAISSMDRHQAMRSANEILRITAAMSTAYRKQPPVELAMMGYYGRELEIWAQADEMEKLKSASSEITLTWNMLRPTIVERGGNDQAQRLDSIMNQLASAKSSMQYKSLAGSILIEVQGMKSLFAI